MVGARQPREAVADWAMMRQLLLLRHAKSAWDDPALSDHARPLNARGRKAAAAMALAMRDFGIVPDVVLVSSARRTLQTLEAFAPFEQGALVEPLDALYLASWQQMLDVIRRVPETARSVMLVGHNPGLHDLAMGLADPNASAKDAPMLRRLAEGYPTGALAEFLVATPWQLLESGTGRLVRFVVPGDLLPAELMEQPT
jgi:phosphohistidine phosphatase